MPWSLTVARIGGTAVRIHVTFVLFLVWIAFSAWARGGPGAALDSTAFIGMLVFMPIWFTTVIHFTLTEWLRLLSITMLSNMIWNMLWGVIGDRAGWRKTAAWGRTICKYVSFLPRGSGIMNALT